MKAFASIALLISSISFGSKIDITAGTKKLENVVLGEKAVLTKDDASVVSLLDAGSGVRIKKVAPSQRKNLCGPSLCFRTRSFRTK